MFKNLPYYLL